MTKLILILSLFGCSESTTVSVDGGESDSTMITFDAPVRPDATPEEDADQPDAMARTNDFGDKCESDADCDGVCITDFEGGYCSRQCNGDFDCDGGRCGRGACFAECDPASTDRTCGQGLGCTSAPMFPGACLPGCFDDSDCGEGLTCDRLGGFAGEGSCFDPDSQIGSPCEDDDECGANAACLSEEDSGFPGGSCIGFGCDSDSNTGCEGDAVCLPNGRGTLCVDGCVSDDDCRTGLTCQPSTQFPDRMFCGAGCDSDSQCGGGRVCRPDGNCAEPLDATELGTQCSQQRNACQGGDCLTEFASGFPGSYCSYLGCDDAAADADDNCPGTGVCITSGNVTACLEGCTVGSCRAGYACRMVDADRADRGMGCFPACVDDDDCANDGSNNSPDFSCNVGTGRCDYPFDTATAGQPCVDRDQCNGGRCLTEADDGYPGGMCAARGCALTSTMDPQVACEDGFACAADPRGLKAGFGICLPTCTDVMECRTGYACTDGFCSPPTP